MNIQQRRRQFKPSASPPSARDQLSHFLGKSMACVTKDIQPTESAEYRGAIHWVTYLRPAFLASFGYAGVMGMPGVHNLDSSWLTTLSLGVLELVFFWGVLGFLSACFTDWSTGIAVTDRRIVLKRGFIHRQSIEINVDKVESAEVTQTALGRILNYGDILIAGPRTGMGSIHLQNVAAPFEFRDRIVARRSHDWHFDSSHYGGAIA